MRVYLAFCGAAIGFSALALIDPRAAAFGAGMGLAWLVLAFLGALLIGRLMHGDVRDERVGPGQASGFRSGGEAAAVHDDKGLPH